MVVPGPRVVASGDGRAISLQLLDGVEPDAHAGDRVHLRLDDGLVPFLDLDETLEEAAAVTLQGATISL